MEYSEKSFSNEELDFLIKAAKFFDDPGLFVTGLNNITKQFEHVQNIFPDHVRDRIAQISRSALEEALKFSIKTIPAIKSKSVFLRATQNSRRSCFLHASVLTAVGGVGGFFGLTALPIELPFVTIVLLRLIAEIAGQYGNDLAKLETRLECLYVLSLGNHSLQETGLESYYASRVAFSELFLSASSFIVSHTVTDILVAIENRTAPALVRMIAEIAVQFEIRVTKKLLAQTVPITGVMGGAGLNFLFSHYFGEYARYHFGLKSLERIYGFEKTQTILQDARF